MKTIKYFLVLPFALSAMTSCGGKFSKISFNEAAKIAKNYADSISTNKASDIVVSGHVNNIHIKGDATYWSYQPQGFEDEELFSYIPNFSFKNAEIKVDEHDLAKATLPSSLTSLASKLTEGMKKKYGLVFSVLGNLPKFPMNPHLLICLYGIDGDVPRDDEGNILWDDIKTKEWEKADVKLYKDGAKLKVTMDTDDAIGLLGDISSCFKERKKTELVETTMNAEDRKIPLSLSLTTNKIGYIDSLSIKTNVKNIDEELPQDDTEMFYFHIKGDLEVDLTLKFKQEFSDPFTIKYQLNVYRKAKLEDGEIPDVIYNNGSENIPLKLNKDECIDPTTSLKKLSNYVNFNWYSNVENATLKEVEDDPIFGYTYWKTSPNIAFTNDSYDTLVIPAQDKTGAPKYAILGAYSSESSEPINRSLINTSIDGKVVSSDTGLPQSSTEKILTASADSLQPIKKGDIEGAPVLLMDEIFINSNLLNSKKSEYIVSLAVAPHSDIYGE